MFKTTEKVSKKSLKLIGKTRSWSFNLIIKLFKLFNRKLISKERKLKRGETYSKIRIEYLCPNKHLTSITINHIISLGFSCRHCYYRKYSLNQELVFNYIKKLGYTILTKTYINSIQKLKIQCKRGHIFYRNFNTFKSKKYHHCAECKNEDYINKIKTFVEKKGYKFISITKFKKAIHPKMNLICPVGHHFKIRWSHFKEGHRCKKCYCANNSGENNPQWNPNKSNKVLDRLLRKKWSRKIMERDNFCCQKCGNNKRLNSHHLNGSHWDKENRYNVNNGVTLCEKCHKEFHKIYGRKYNKLSQYNQWNSNRKIDDNLPKIIINYK